MNNSQEQIGLEDAIKMAETASFHRESKYKRSFRPEGEERVWTYGTRYVAQLRDMNIEVSFDAQVGRYSSQSGAEYQLNISRTGETLGSWSYIFTLDARSENSPKRQIIELYKSIEKKAKKK